MDIRDKTCVVIGGGKVARRKLMPLLDAGASVKIVSPQVKDEVSLLAQEGKIKWIEREYVEGDLEGSALAFVAVDDQKVAERAAAEANRLKIPVNSADMPDSCSFTLPAYLERGDLLVTVSTGGKCPALSKKLKEKLAQTIDDSYGEFLDILGDARKMMIDNGLSHDKCRDLLNNLIESDILHHIREGSSSKAREFAAMSVAEAFSKTKAKGE